MSNEIRQICVISVFPEMAEMSRVAEMGGMACMTEMVGTLGMALTAGLL